jgi:hypothetical protein
LEENEPDNFIIEMASKPIDEYSITRMIDENDADDESNKPVSSSDDNKGYSE